MKIETFIKNLPFFSSFNEEQLRILSKYLEHRVFYKGNVLLRQGKKGNELLIIKSGGAEIAVCKPGGESMHVANTQVGNCYGEVSMLTGDIITASVIASETVECYSFSREKLNVLRIIQPDLVAKVENAIAISAVEKIENMVNMARNIYQKRRLSSKFQSFDTLNPFELAHDKSHEILPRSETSEPLMRSVPAFSSFDDSEIIDLLKYCQIISYEKGGIVCYDDHHSIDVVCSGILQLFDDVLPKISFTEPGTLYGQITFFDEKFKIDAFCREDTVLIRFELDKIALMCKEHFAIWAKFHRIICSQVVKRVYDVDRLILRLESEG